MAKAHDRAPLGTDANGERHDVMLAERFTCANPVDQESAVAAERRKDQYTIWPGWEGEREEWKLTIRDTIILLDS